MTGREGPALAERPGRADGTSAGEAARGAAMDAYGAVRELFSSLGSLRAALERMPPASRSASLHGGEHGGLRTVESLIEELLRRDRGDRLLYLPARAVLGRAVAVAEAQAWSALSLAYANAGAPERSASEAQANATAAVLGLMAEDAYRDIVDGAAPVRTKRAAAKRLVALWDARPAADAEPSTSALLAVWSSRRRCPPVFGTLLGSMELMVLSMSLDERWYAFVGERLSDLAAQEALAEFLFGLSHEELGLAADYIERNGAQDPQGLLGLFGNGREYPEAASADPRDLYRFYEARRAAARARAAASRPGPKATLEELYLRWTLERPAAR